MAKPSRRHYDTAVRVSALLRERHPPEIVGAYGALPDWTEDQLEAWRDADACRQVIEAWERTTSCPSTAQYRVTQAGERYA
jgi:hypothetical protein